MKVLAPSPKLQFFDDDGSFLAGGKVDTYAAGTLSPLATYADKDGTANATTIILNSRGEAAVFLEPGKLYDFHVKRADGSLVYVQEDVFEALIEMPAGFGINQPASGAHFAQNGAGIHRLNDRLFVGAATVNDGLFQNITKDWLSTFQVAGGIATGSMASATFGVLTTGIDGSAGAILGGSQSLNFNSAGTACIPISGYAINNNATLATSAWAGYFEAHKTTAASGSIYGIEIDTRTTVASIQPSPFQQGDVIGLQIASGAEYAASPQFDGSAAVQIAGNPKRYKVGINFMSDALVDIGGGFYTAMTLPKGAFFQWFAAAGSATSIINCSATANTTACSLDLASDGLRVTAAANGVINLLVAGLSTAVNYALITPAATGNGVKYGVAGTDANIDVTIEPKGSGTLKMAIANYRNFANDAAAAAASPPVPIGGLYRNGSVVQVRVT